jgi:hypothetical protein
LTKRFQVLSTFNLRTSISPFSDSFGVFVALKSIHRMGLCDQSVLQWDFVLQLLKTSLI